MALEEATGIPTQILLLDQKTLLQGLATDPLYQAMLSRCVSLKRLIYNIKRQVNYQILDLHLLKSKTLAENYNFLDGNEKYNLTRNMLAIDLFLKGKKISPETIDSEILRQFRIESEKIRKNTIDKKPFLKTYNQIYNQTFNRLLKKIPHDTKSQQTHSPTNRQLGQRHTAQNTRESHR